MVPKSTNAELKEAELGAYEAFKLWKEVPVQQKQRVFFKLQHLIREYTEELAVSITTEQGKTLQDARGDIFRGLEVVESACAMGHLTMGESAENLSRGLDTYTFRQPLGVTAGICPFNFPAMIPLWMFPVATVCGNITILKPSEKYIYIYVCIYICIYIYIYIYIYITVTLTLTHTLVMNSTELNIIIIIIGNTMILKPSEKDPGACMIIARLAKEAGLPDGMYIYMYI
jgi:acyl-CoA reductase-like NAD-dependent aldehyde dehydrogenase